MKKQFNLSQKFMPKRIYSWIFAACCTIGLFSQCQSEQKIQTNADTTSDTTKTIQSPEEPVLASVSNSKFEVKVFSIDTIHAVYADQNRLIVGNKKDEKFVTLDTEYKNISGVVSEVDEGELTITQSGKAHKFNFLTNVLLDGYTTSLEKIAPNSTKRGKLLYKVPRNLTGKVTWRPDSTSNVVELGDIK